MKRTALNLAKLDDLKNRIILINQQSKEVLDYVETVVDMNLMEPGAETLVKNLNNAAIRLTGAVMEEQLDLAPVESTFLEVQNMFRTLESNYLPRSWTERYNFEPMKKIEESIVHVKRLLAE